MPNPTDTTRRSHDLILPALCRIQGDLANDEVLSILSVDRGDLRLTVRTQGFGADPVTTCPAIFLRDVISRCSGATDRVGVTVTVTPHRTAVFSAHLYGHPIVVVTEAREDIREWLGALAPRVAA